MKVVYMQETLNLIAHTDPSQVQNLIAAGEVKITQQEINYLLITLQHEDTTVQ